MAMSFNSFGFVLSGNNAKGGYLNSDNESKSSNNESENTYQATAITATDDNCFDGFAGKSLMGTIDDSNMAVELFAATEAASAVAYDAETAGSVAYSGAETAGSVACDFGGDFGGSSDSGFMG